MKETLLAAMSFVSLLSVLSVPAVAFAQDDSAKPPAVGQPSEEERAARRQQARENAGNLSEEERQARREARREQGQARRGNGQRPGAGSGQRPGRGASGQRPNRGQGAGARPNPGT